MKQSKYYFTLICFFTACSLTEKKVPVTTDQMNPEIKEFVSPLPVMHSATPACLGMVKEFCDTLYSPDNQGRLLFTAGNSHFNVKMGRTENDFWQKDFEFLKTRLMRWKDFPADLKGTLNNRDFLKKMKSYLSRVVSKNMTLEDRTKMLHDEDEINFIWNLALKETVLIRMEKHYPGYSKIKEDMIPLELRYEAQRQKKILMSEMAKIIWSNHPNWKKVENKFENIKSIYQEVIQESADLPKNLKKSWVKRISKVKLIIPGSDPEMDLDDCFRNESNAYYFSDKNYLTVCAGDFNSEEIEQTLAHELGHSLDMARTRFLFEEQLKIGKNMKEIKERSCSNRPFSCRDWERMKANFKDSLLGFKDYQVELPEFNSCLQGKSTISPIPDDYLSRVAKEDVDSTLSDLAQRNIFLRIISPVLPLSDGSSQINPMYLNPCGYYLWENQAHPFDDDVSLLLFFTAEYRCSKDSSAELKFKDSIDRAKELQTALEKSRLEMEGKFSDNDRLVTDGYAVPPTERFADALGEKVFSRILKNETDVKIRRARYLANTAWLCRKPSIQKLFPIEASVQKSYYVEPHSDTAVRQKELLTNDIREVLTCRQDFELNQCKLEKLH